MDNAPHSEEDYFDATSHRADTHTQAFQRAEANKRLEHEAEPMFSGVAKSSSEKRPVDKLKLHVRVVLTRMSPSALACHAAQSQDNCAQSDRTSCDHGTSSVQVNLHSEVCAANTDKSAPQYIVDEEAIMQLMKTCPMCNKQCRCNKYTRGPYFIVYQSCYFCDHRRKWANQPEAIDMNIRKRHALCPRQEQGVCKS